MQEYAYLCQERNQILQGEEQETEDYEWIEMVDFKSGELKRYKKFKQADHLL